MFVWINNTYVNLLRVDNIRPHSEDHVTLEYPDGGKHDVRGDDARAILARLQDTHPDDTRTSSYPREAVNQAQELAKTLGGNSDRTFTFTDERGQNREGTVSKIYGGWVAEVDGQRFEGASEAAAMAAVMSGVV